jgi:nanoRNase/pAp phosphatase (c-di-AMP/oligoRNAs hydrolase)
MASGARIKGSFVEVQEMVLKAIDSALGSSETTV